MKPRRLIFVTSLLATAFSAVSYAATFQWDPNGSAAGLGGDGFWDLVTPNWDLVGTGLDDGTDAVELVTPTFNDTLVFGGVGGVITPDINLAVEANHLIFNVAGYDLGYDNSQITLGGTAPKITTLGDTTISTLLTGSVQWEKLGAAKLNVPYSNTTDGGTKVSEGWIEFADGGLGQTGAVVMNGGGLLWTALDGYGTANTSDISSRLTLVSGKVAKFDMGGNTVNFASGMGSGTTASLLKVGTGTMVLVGQSSYTGGTTVQGGTLRLNNGSNGGNTRLQGEVTVQSGAVLQTTGTGGGTNTGLGWNSQVTGLTIEGGVFETTDGSGSHIWNIPNGVNLTGATMRSNGGVATTTGPQFEWNRATVNVLPSATTSEIAGRINIRSDNSYTAVPFVVADGAAATDLLVSAAVTNNSAGLGISKSGAGTMVMTAGNTYTGATQVTGGVLELSGAGGSILSSAPSLSNGATLRLKSVAADSTTNRLGDTVAVNLSGGKLEFAHDGASATNFAESTGNLNVLSGLNEIKTSQAAVGSTSVLNFTGVSVTAGTVNFVGTGLGVDGRNQIKIASGVTDGALIPWAMVNGSSLATYSSVNGVQAVSNYTDVPYAGVINDAPLANVRLVGGVSGDVTLGSAVTTVNTILQNQTGAVNVSGAGKTLRLAAAGTVVLPDAYGALTIGGSGSVLTAGGADNTAGVLTLNNLSAGTTALTIDSVIANNGTGTVGVTTSGSGRVVLSGLNTYTGTTTLGAGSTEMAGATQTWSGVIAGSGLLKKTNPASTLTLSGTNTITGPIQVAEGVLKLGSAGGFGSSSMLTVASGATLDVAGVSQTTVRPMTLAGTGTSGQGALYNSSTTTGPALGALNLAADALITSASTASMAVPSINLAGYKLTIGSCRLYMSNGNISSGNIDVNNGGVIYWAASGTQTGGTGTISLKTGATIDVRDFSNTAWTNRQTISLDGGVISNGGTVAGSPGNGGGAQSTIGNPIAVGTSGGSLTGNNTAFGLHMNMTGALSGSGPLTLNGGQGVRFQGNTSAYTGTVSHLAGKLVFSSATDNSFNGNLTGSGELIKESSNVLTLSGANAGTGATTLQGGSLKLDYSTNNNRKINAGVLTMSGATIDLSGGSFQDSVASTTLTANTINSVTRSSGSATLSMGTITRNTGALLNFSDSGIARTTNANDSSGLLGTWMTIGGTRFAKNDGTGLIVAADVTDVTRRDSGSRVILDGATQNIRLVEGTGTLGTITLGSPVTHIATLTQSAEGGNSPATVENAGKTLTLGSILVTSGAGALTIGSDATGVLKANATTIDVGDVAGAGLTIQSVITNGTGPTSLNKLTAGTLTLSAENTYSGGTQVAAGTLTASLGTTAGNRTVFGTGAISAASGSTLRFLAGSTGNTMTHANALNLSTATLTSEDANQVYTGAISLTGSNTVHVVYADKGATISGAVSGGGSIIKTGPGVLTMAGTGTYTGGTTVNSGTLKVASTSGIGASGQALTLAGGSLLLASDAAVSSKNMTVSNNATVTLDRASYGGSISTTFGSLSMGAANRTLTVNRGSNVADNATMVFSGDLSNDNNTTTFDLGAGVTVQHSGGMPGGARTTAVTKTGVGTLILAEYGNWDGGNNTALNGGTLELRGVMGDSGNYRSVTAAAGTTLRLANDSNKAYYSGLTAASGANLEVGRITAGTTSMSHTLGALSVGGTLNVNRASSLTGAGVGSVAFTGAAAMTSATTFTVGTNTTLDLQGVLSGAFALTKTGPGTLSLQGANTYSGTTTISGGVLVLQGGSANNITSNLKGSTTTINGGGTLRIYNTPTTYGTDRVNASPITLAGGKIDFSHTAGAASYSEQFSALTVGSGANTISTSQAATGQTSMISFASLARTGGSVNFVGTGLGTTVDTKNEIRFTTPPTLTNGIIGTWATVNGTDFATVTGANNSVVAYTAYTDVTRKTGVAPETGVITDGSSTNVRIVEGTGTTLAPLTLSAAVTTVNTLTQSASGGTSAASINTAGQTLVTNSILVSSGAGGLTIGAGGTAGTLKNPATALQVIENSSNGSTIQSVIADGTGASSFSKAGTGTLTLTATNTYTGATSIDGGVLAVSSIANGGTASGLGASANGQANLVINDATLRYTGNTVTTNRGFTINGGSTATLDVSTSGQSLFMSGGIANTNANLVKTGAGTLALSGAMNHTGTTTVSGGTLRAAASIGNQSSWNVGTGARMELAATNLVVGGHSIAVADSKTFVVDGGTLALDGGFEARLGNVSLSNGANMVSNRGLGSWDWLFGAVASGAPATITVANTSGTAASTMTAGSAGNGIHMQGAVNFNVADVTASTAADLTVSMVLADPGATGGTAGAINKLGAGTLLLSGTNTFTGSVAVSAGVAQIGNTQAFGPNNTAVTKVSFISGAAVDFNGLAGAAYGYTIAGTGISSAGALVNTGAAITGTQASNLALAADASIGGTGNWALNAAANAATTLTLNGYTLTKSGANTVSLINTTITAGTLKVSGGVLATATTASSGTSTAVTLDNTAGAKLSLGADLTIGSLAGGGSTGGALELGGSTLTTGALNASTSYSGTISSTTGGNIVKNGTGTFTINQPSGTVDPKGGITVNGGALVMNAGGSYPNYVGGAITLNNGTNLSITGSRYDFTNTNFVFGAAGGASITTNSSTNWVGGGSRTYTTMGGAKNTINGTGTINTNGAHSTFQVVRGTDPTSDLDLDVPTGNPTLSENVIKNGDGILTFKAVNTYKGTTTVNAGSLMVNNTTGFGIAGPGAVTVKTTATLGGSGSIAPAVTVESGATLSPGVSGVETLDFGDAVTLAAGSTYKVDVTGTTTCDKVILAANKTFTANGTITLVPNGHSFAAGDQFDVVDATTIAGTPTISPATPGTGLEWDTTAFATTGVIAVKSSVLPGYDTWASAISDPAQRGRTADPDGDGFSNLQEFLFGTSPSVNNGALVEATSDGTHLTLRWLQRATVATYSVQASPSLDTNSWSPLLNPTPAQDTNQSGAPTDYRYWSVSIPLGSGKHFYRVQGQE